MRQVQHDRLTTVHARAIVMQSYLRYLGEMIADHDRSTRQTSHYISKLEQHAASMVAEIDELSQSSRSSEEDDVRLVPVCSAHSIVSYVSQSNALFHDSRTASTPTRP